MGRFVSPLFLKMKIKLSKEIEKALKMKNSVINYFKVNEANPQTIASYCSMVGTPIIPTYYFLITELNRKDLQQDMERLCKFYNIEVDYGEP